jgi:hypothetical protein
MAVHSPHQPDEKEREIVKKERVAATAARYSSVFQTNGRLEAAVRLISRPNAVPPLALVTNKPLGRAQREGKEDNAKDHEKKAS